MINRVALPYDDLGPRRIWGYGRKSPSKSARDQVASRGASDSIEGQREGIRAWCEDDPDSRIWVGFDFDDLVHGDATRRDGLQRSIARVRQGIADDLAVLRLDRFGRDEVMELVWLIQELRHAGALVWVCSEPDLDPRDADYGSKVIRRAETSRSELLQIRGRTRDALRARRKRGMYLGRIPLGWRLRAPTPIGQEHDCARDGCADPARRSRWAGIEPGVDSAEYEQVKRIFELRRAGFGWTRLARALGMPVASVRVVVGTERNRELVGNTDWEAANAVVLGARGTGQLRRYIFAGLLFCWCGARMVGNDRLQPTTRGPEWYRSYVCGARRVSHREQGCTALHGLVMAAVRSTFERMGDIDEALSKRIAGELATPAGDGMSLYVIWQQQRDAIEQERRDALDQNRKRRKNGQKMLPDDELARIMDRLDEQEEHLGPPPIEHVELTEAIQVIAGWRSVLVETDVPEIISQQNAILRRIIERIDVGSKGRDIRVKLRDPYARILSAAPALRVISGGEA